MNALTVLFLAATAACSSGHLLGYPGLYNYPGFLGPYHSLLPYAAPLSHNALHPASFSWKSVAPAPLTYSTYSPSVAPFAPVAPIQSQYHAQDELGQYSFGYAGGPSSRTEVRDAFGVVRGSYNYVDSEGKVQTQHYVADALGFRVAGTNLPVAPEAPHSSAPLALPEPVQDTPEVAAAKVAFKAAYDEAAAAAAAAPDSR